MPSSANSVCVCDYSMEEACRFHALNALTAVFSHSVRKTRWWNIMVTNNGQFPEGMSETLAPILPSKAAQSTWIITFSCWWKHHPPSDFMSPLAWQRFYSVLADSLLSGVFSSNHWSSRQGCDWMTSMGLLASQSCCNKFYDSHNRNLFPPSSGSQKSKIKVSVVLAVVVPFWELAGRLSQASPLVSSGLLAILGIPWLLDESPALCLHLHMVLSICVWVCVQISPFYKDSWCEQQTVDSLEKNLMLEKTEGRKTAEDEMFGWHHCLSGHEFEQTPGDSEGQGGLACCSPWGHKELYMNWQPNNNNVRTPVVLD